MAHPHSHPICPTCQSDLSGRKDLEYFVSTSPDLPTADDGSEFYEETYRLLHFLGALAEAGPHAAAEHAAELGDTPGWVQWLSWLAEELTNETERRLCLLRDAGQIWKDRAEGMAASKTER